MATGDFCVGAVYRENIMTSITMLVHDRPRLTEQALRSLYENTDPKIFTLTVVDDASTDFRTTRLLERYAADHRNMALITLKTSKGITGQARNLAVYWSEKYFGAGDWLYLSDNDVYFLPPDPAFGKMSWLDRITTMASGSEDVGFRLWGGQIHPYHQPIKQMAVDMTEHSMLDGPSWLMRWDTWHKYGPLECHTPGVCQGEDVTFCQRLTAPGNGGSYRDAERHNGMTQGGGRIGVISPHVVAHTGIRQSNGNLAPGADVRLQQAILGIIYE